MKELSTSARDYLDALRTVDAPPAEASTRVWDAVSTRAASGELGPELPAEPSGLAGAGATASTTSIKAIALGVLVGAGVAIAAAAAVLGDGSPAVVAATPGLVGLAVLPHPEPSAPVPSDVMPVADEAVVEIAEAIAAPSVEPALRAARVRTSPRTVTARTPEAKETADPVAEEVALLAEARSALGAGEASRAIGVLARHRKRFPEGLLARERDVSWITALCVLGRVEEARTKAKSFLRAHGSSPHAAKVRASCGGRED
jgi:hypothetical protein